jgi:hypothetical protein
MTLDARGREAGRAFRAEIERMRTTGADRASIERFERVRADRQRGQRIGAGLLAAVVAVAGIVFVARMFRGAERSAPAAPKVPGGIILYGNWDANVQQADWFTVGPDGSPPHDLHVTATCAVWFPDGSKILITNDAAVGAGTPLRPAVIDPNGSNLRPLDATRNPDLNLGCGNLSLDGIYSVRASDGGGLVRLLEGPVSPPRYSPDGTRLSFFDTKEGVGPTGSGALFVMGSDGTGLVRITPWGYAFDDHAWSPDGRWIVFQRPYGQMYVVRPDGSDLHRVPVSLPRGTGALNPSWSPDGTWIVFSLQRPGHAEIHMARPDGTGLRKVTGAPDVQAQHPEWIAASG